MNTTIKNNYFLQRLYFLWIILFLSASCVGQTGSLTTLTVTTDNNEAVTVSLEPLSHWMIYTYVSANINPVGPTTLQYDATVPFLAELKIKNKIGRIVQNVQVYVYPSASLQINVMGKNAEFKGETREENRVLQQVYPLFSQLDRPASGIENLRKQLQENLRNKIYKSSFEKEMLKAIDLCTLVKTLAETQTDTIACTKVLQQLRLELRSAHEWLFLPTWPKVLDHIFLQAEALGILSSCETGYENRLQCIGNEEVRNRYTIYVLTSLIRSRSWFGNTPTEIIRKAEPYLTSTQAREQLKSVVREMEHINQEWDHLLHLPAPDFTFEDVNGKMVSLSDFRGKFVLLDVWNIYCGPCMNQIPHLRQMEPELKKIGVEVIGVSCDPQKIKDKWKTTVHEKEMAGTQVIMDSGRHSRFMNDYCIPNFPTFCLINPDGYMVHPRMKYPEMPGFMEFIKKKVNEYNSLK